MRNTLANSNRLRRTADNLYDIARLGWHGCPPLPLNRDGEVPEVGQKRLKSNWYEEPGIAPLAPSDFLVDAVPRHHSSNNRPEGRLCSLSLTVTPPRILPSLS